MEYEILTQLRHRIDQDRRRLHDVRGIAFACFDGQ